MLGMLYNEYSYLSSAEPNFLYYVIFIHASLKNHGNFKNSNPSSLNPE